MKKENSYILRKCFQHVGNVLEMCLNWTSILRKDPRAKLDIIFFFNFLFPFTFYLFFKFAFFLLILLFFQFFFFFVQPKGIFDFLYLSSFYHTKEPLILKLRITLVELKFFFFQNDILIFLKEKLFMSKVLEKQREFRIIIFLLFLKLYSFFLKKNYSRVRYLGKKIQIISFLLL